MGGIDATRMAEKSEQSAREREEFEGSGFQGIGSILFVVGVERLSLYSFYKTLTDSGN